MTFLNSLYWKTFILAELSTWWFFNLPFNLSELFNLAELSTGWLAAELPINQAAELSTEWLLT